MAERLDNGADDEAFDIGTRRVVRAKAVTLARIESTLQEGAEDRGLDVFPFGGGGEAEDVELLTISADARGRLAQLDWKAICGMRDVLIHVGL